MPTFAQIGLLQRLTGLIYFPVTPLFPHFGAARRRLPAGQVPHPLPRADPHRPVGRAPVGRQGARADGRRGRPRADPGRARRHGRPPPLGVARMTPADPRHRLSTYWGGRLAQALERDPRSRRSSASAPTTRRCELERTEFVRVGIQHALLRRIVQAAEIDTVIDTRLVVDSLHGAAARRPRGQRDRDDEHPRRLRRARTRRCARSSSSPPRTTTAASATTRRSSPRSMRAPAPAAHARSRRDIVEAEKAVEGFAERNPDVDGHRPALLQRARARACGPPTRACSSCPASRASSASTRATSSSTRTTSSACSQFAAERRPARASTTRPATACSRSRRSPRCSASRSRRSCRRGAPRWPPRRCAARRPGARRGAQPAALRPRAGQPQAQGRGLHVRLHEREAVLKHAEALRVRGAAARRGRAVPLRARGRGVPALEPERRAAGRCNAAAV